MAKDLSLQAIRKLQTLTLTLPIETDDPKNPQVKHSSYRTFEAYAQAPVNFTFTEKTEGIAEKSTFGKVLSATMMLSGRAPALDYERKFMYRGLEPISLNFNCFLILDDFEAVTKANTVSDLVYSQFRQPLYALFEYMLPTRKENLVEDGGLGDRVFQTIKKGANFILTKLSSMIGGDVGDLLTDFEGDPNKSLADTIGAVYTLDLPPQYRLTNHANAVAKWGRFKWKEVSINSLTISIPQLIYENGLPQYIQISLGLQSLRMPTLNQVKGYGSSKVLNECSIFEIE